MDFIEKLRLRLQEPLPGWAAQWEMASHRLVEPPSNTSATRRQAPQKHKTAGVLALLYQKQGLWHTALMHRTPSTFVHGRQVSFPGGGAEPDDADPGQTALRETEEEFGILRHHIQLLGALTELYIPASNYLVHPFVGYIPGKAPGFNPDPNEVAEIMEVPLQHLFDPERRKTTEIRLSQELVLPDVPYYDLLGRVVWGATAMMLSELSVVLRQAGFGEGTISNV